MMGIEIDAKPGPIPRDLILRLRCDGDHGFLERFDTFEGADFILMRAEATRMGWKQTYGLAVRQTPAGPKVGVARLFLCPACAKKTPTVGDC